MDRWQYRNLPKTLDELPATGTFDYHHGFLIKKLSDGAVLLEVESSYRRNLLPEDWVDILIQYKVSRLWLGGRSLESRELVLPIRLVEPKCKENLKILWLNGLRLTEVPPVVCQLNLTILWLNSNNLRAIPEEICNLVNLNILNLDSNRSLVKLPPHMGHRLKKLEKFWCHYTELPRKLWYGGSPRLRQWQLKIYGEQALSTPKPKDISIDVLILYQEKDDKIIVGKCNDILKQWNRRGLSNLLHEQGHCCTPVVIGEEQEETVNLAINNSQLILVCVSSGFDMNVLQRVKEKAINKMVVVNLEDSVAKEVITTDTNVVNLKWEDQGEDDINFDGADLDKLKSILATIQTENITRTVLLVNALWGNVKDRISIFNRNVGRLLTSAKFNVLATVLEATEEEKRDAEKLGIELIYPHEDTDGEETSKSWLEKPGLYFPRVKDLAENIDIVIGHCLALSKASVLSSKFIKRFNPETKLYMLNHVTTDIELYKDNATPMSIDEKQDQISTAAKSADKIFSIGFKVFDHCGNLYRADDATMDKDHYIFLPKPEQLFFDQFKGKGMPKATLSGKKTVLSFGPVNEVEKLKGYDIAARAMGKLIKALKEAQQESIPDWEIRGIAENNWKEELEKLQTFAESWDLKPKVYVYSTQKDVIAQLRRCHLVIMTSRTEPFGLVGLEAMALGVPTLVNWNSGLADFIKKYLPHFKYLIVNDTSVLDNNEEALEHDAAIWSSKIIEVLQNHDMWIDRAAQLKEALKTCPAIEESHKLFLDKCQNPK